MCECKYLWKGKESNSRVLKRHEKKCEKRWVFQEIHCRIRFIPGDWKINKKTRKYLSRLVKWVHTWTIDWLIGLIFYNPHRKKEKKTF